MYVLSRERNITFNDDELNVYLSNHDPDKATEIKINLKPHFGYTDNRFRSCDFLMPLFEYVGGCKIHYTHTCNVNKTFSSKISWIKLTNKNLKKDGKKNYFIS